MSQSNQTDALNRMHVAVKEITHQLDTVDDLPHESLADLKGAVDDVRHRLWAVLMAANTDDYRGFSERYRLRRMTEICQGILADVDAGRLSLTHREAAELGIVARELGRRITAHTAG